MELFNRQGYVLIAVTEPHPRYSSLPQHAATPTLARREQLCFLLYIAFMAWIAVLHLRFGYSLAQHRRN